MRETTALGRVFQHGLGGVLSVIAKRPWAVFLFFLALAAVVYGPFVASPFFFDDLHSVRDNPAIRSLRNIPAFFTDPGAFSLHGRGKLYRPVLLTSYATSYAVTGPEPWSFRIVNLFLHAVNGFVVFLLLRRLVGNGRNEAAALAGALLFTGHPAQTQAVMYVSSRSEILAASFVFLTLLAFLRAYHGRPKDAGVSFPAWGAALMAFTLALFTKASGVLLLPGALLAGLAVTPDLNLRSLRRLALSLIPFVVMHLGHSWLKASLNAPLSGAGELIARAAGPVAGGEDVWLRISAFGVYLRLALVPYPLSIFHELPAYGLARTASVTLSLALLLALIVGSVVAFRKGRRQLALGMSWFPAMLVVYFLVFLHLKVNEHRLYLALFGLAVIAADLFRHARSRHSATILIAVLCLYVAGTVFRNRQWMDEESFWLNEVAAAPSDAWPYENLALFYDRAGRTEEAVETFEQARVRPRAHLGLIHNYFGLLHARAGRLEEAREELLQAVVHDPESPDYLSNLGSVMDDLGRVGGAEEYLERAIAVAPCFAKAHFNLGLLYGRTNRMAEAERSLRLAVKCDQRYGRAHALLGSILLERRDKTAALRHLELAASLPGASGDVFYELARARARAGMGTAALAALERAAALGCSSLRGAAGEPDFAGLRNLPRFRRLADGLGR